MALDSEFFDSISLEEVKNKYYGTEEVEAVFQSIREEAEKLQEQLKALTAEKETLRSERSSLRMEKKALLDEKNALLAEKAAMSDRVASLMSEKAALVIDNSKLKERVAFLGRQRDDISDVVMTAREVCNRMIEEAQQKSAALVAAADAERRQILRSGVIRQDYTVKKVEASFARVREIQLSALEAMNEEWQAFLIDMPDDEMPDLAALQAPPPEMPPIPDLTPAHEPEPEPEFETEYVPEPEYEPEYIPEPEPEVVPEPEYIPGPEPEAVPEPEYIPAYRPEEKRPSVSDIPIPDDLADKVSSIVDQILAMHNAVDPDEDF